MSVDPARLLLLAGGVAGLVVGAVVLAAAPGRASHRALAGLLAARGLTNVLPAASSQADWVWAAARVQPYFVLAIVPLAVYCTAALPRWDGASRPRGGWATGACILALAAAYALDHGLFYGLAAGPAAVGALQAGPGIHYTSLGPLIVLGAAMPLALATLGLRLVLAYRRRPAHATARPLLLLAAGLLVTALFDGASRLATLTALLDGPGGFPWLPWGWSLAVLPPLALAPAALGLAALASGRTFPRPEHRLESATLLLGALAFFSGFARLALPASSDPGGHPAVLVLLGFWRLALPAAAAAAVLAAPWSSAASRAREAASWGLAGAALALAALAAWQAASAWGPDPAPLLAATAAGTALGLAAVPVVRAARWLTRLVVPGPAARPAEA